MKIKKLSLSVKIALLVLIVSLFGISILSYISYEQSKKIFLEHTSQIVSKNIEQYTNFIKENIQKLKYNITIFSYNPSVKGFMRSYFDKYKYDEKTNKTFGQYKKDVSTIMKLMMKQNPSYFQMRIINAKNGQEILKLIKKHKKVEILKKTLLQNKWERNYVQQTLKSKTNIYLSKINLNKEFHVIEFPIKPTIRIAKIIFTNNKKSGITVINANIKTLFDFERLRKLKDTHTFIANKEGYYIFNQLYPQKEFGWEFGRDFKITNDFPFLKKFYNSDRLSLSIIDYKHNKIYEARKVYIYPGRFIVILKTTTPSIFKNKAKDYIYKLGIAVAVIAIIIALLTTLLVSVLMKPIKKLTETANKIAKSKGKIHYDIEIKSNDEIGELANSFKIMLNTLEDSKKELEQFAEKLEMEVEKKTKELQKINKNLQNIVDEKVKELREKDQALTQQSKMAAMGEMIGAIAHQWRQPLNSLAINIQMLEDMIENNEINEHNIQDFIHKNMQTIHFMSNTIDDFRNFFRKDKEAVRFNVKEAVEKTINLQKAQLKNNNINIKTDLKDAYTKGFKNEFMQIILNLISNAKDAIIEKRIKENSDFPGEIFITNEITDNKIIIRIKDNGTGISDHIKHRVFEPYFTTKEEGKGTGMGLYMVKEILRRMDGKIYFNESERGTEFIIELKKDSDGKQN